MQLGQLVARRGLQDQPQESYVSFWEKKLIRWPDLGLFAAPLGKPAVSEAAVERAFSVQSRILTKLRSRLTEEACEAQLWLSLNHTKVMEPGKYNEQVEKNRTTTKNKRDMLEKEFSAMIQAAKRRRRH